MPMKADSVSTSRLPVIVVLFIVLATGLNFNSQGQSKPKLNSAAPASASPSPGAPATQPTPDLTQISIELDNLDEKVIEIKRHLLNGSEIERAQDAAELSSTI